MPSLNAGVSCRKDRGRSNLGEQIHKVGDWPLIKLLYCFDQPTSEILIGERFAQPVELLEDTAPRHGIIKASLVADMFSLQDPPFFSANGDAGTQLLRKTSRELLVGTDVDTRNHRLGVQQRRRDEVFQIVVALLFRPWMILWAIAPASCEVEPGLEDVAAHVLNLCGHETVTALQVQRRFQDRLAMNERAILF